MAGLIQQRIELAGVMPALLFETYVDAVRHAAAIGAPARISREVGAEFAIFGEDNVHGRNLAIVAGELIVQTWRGNVWRRSDPDSILVLAFAEVAGGATIHLTQAGVPDHAHQIIADGWHTMYWMPWRTHLRRRG